MRIADRLSELGLVLPPAPQIPKGTELPFHWVRVVGKRALISGHGPIDANGRVMSARGKVGAEVSREEAYEAARRTGLAILASLERELGTLDRVAYWVRAFGMVNGAVGFQDMPGVINGFSHLILDVFGQERGQHARSAVSVAELPFGIPVEIEAEVEIS